MLPRIALSTQRKMRRVVRTIPEEVYGNLQPTSQGLVAANWQKGGHDSTGDILPISSTEYYTYHTHPRAVYATKNFSVAWPSVQDVEMVFYMISRRDPAQILHVLFTVEGMYFLDFPPETRQKTMEIYRELSSCKEFPCCKNGGTDSDFCDVFDQDSRRGKDRIKQYISSAITHGTIRIRFQRWEAGYQ